MRAQTGSTSKVTNTVGDVSRLRNLRYEQNRRNQSAFSLLPGPYRECIASIFDPRPLCAVTYVTTLCYMERSCGMQS